MTTHGWVDIETSRGQNCYKVESGSVILYDGGMGNQSRQQKLKHWISYKFSQDNHGCFAVSKLLLVSSRHPGTMSHSAVLRARLRLRSGI